MKKISKITKGLKQEVITDREKWAITQLLYQQKSTWFVHAETRDKKSYVEFYITSAYLNRLANGVKLYTLVE